MDRYAIIKGVTDPGSARVSDPRGSGSANRIILVMDSYAYGYG